MSPSATCTVFLVPPGMVTPENSLAKQSDSYHCWVSVDGEIGHQEALRNIMQAVCAEIDRKYSLSQVMCPVCISCHNNSQYLYPDLFCVHLVSKPVVLKGCYTFLLHLSLKWFSRNICDIFCFLAFPHIINLESVVLPAKQILYFAVIFGIFLGCLFYHPDNHYVIEMQMTNKIKFVCGWLWFTLCAWLTLVPLG